MMYLFAPIGAYLYALRGGQYFRRSKEGEAKKNTAVSRAFYALPTAVFIAVIFGFAHAPWYLAAIATAWHILTVCLGHGLFMDMGRWVHPFSATEHEKPITLLIGPENYSWPFWKRWLHNFSGMTLLGLLRHSWVWALYGHTDILHIIVYQCLGLLHGVVYEVSCQLTERFNFAKIEKSNPQFYAEHLVGALLWSIGV